MYKATIDKKIKQIERNVALQAIIPPPKLYSYMQGKGIKTEEEGREIEYLFIQYTHRMSRAAKSKLVTLEEILSAYPEPFRTKVIDFFKKLLEENRVGGQLNM